MIQKYKISNKYKHFKEVDKIFRYRGIVKTRHGKLRLDANERVSDFKYWAYTVLINLNKSI